MKIITITLNPAFDIHYNIENLELNRENYATDAVKNAGGKGINISRALTFFGVENKALLVTGEENGKEFLECLVKEKLFYESINKPGKIRENITLHTNSGETRISCEGSKTDVEVLNIIYGKIKNEYEKDMLVTFTGRLCEGVEKKEAITFIKNLKKLGIKVIVDCNSFNKDDILEIKPYLIKPNEQEISELLGNIEINDSDIKKAAKTFYNEGIENVMISLGANGFIFHNGEGCFKVSVPKITPISTIGAGDSTIAGFAAGLSQGLELCEILRLAGAFGAAACLTEGTNPPEKEKILKLFDEVTCKSV